MADNDKKSGAQSELGHLFVDIGSIGLGGLIKGLNSLNASFLLAQKGAENFIKPIFNMSKNAAQGVVGLDKISSVMGLTVEELQRLQVWSKLNNVSFGDFIGQLQNAQQKIMDVRTGMAEAPAGLARLGLNMFDFDAHDPISFLNQIMAKVSQLDNVTAAAALRWLGLSEDLLYTWQQGNQKFDERLLLNEQELNALRKQQSAWNTLSLTVQKGFAKWISQQEWLNTGLEETANNTDLIYKGINILGTGVKNLGISFKWLYDRAIKPVWDLTVKLFGLIGTLQVQMHSVSNPVKSKDWEELMNNPEKMRKYQESRKKQLEFEKSLSKQIKENKVNAAKVEPKPTSKKKPELNYDYNPTKSGSYNSSSQTGNNNFGVMGSKLLSPAPIEDFSAPAAVNGTLNALPPHLRNTNVSNNISFQINQTITGDNAEQIAQASANAIDDASMNILQAQNQWAV